MIRSSSDAAGTRRHTPAAKATFVVGDERAKAKALAYLEANESGHTNEKRTSAAKAALLRNIYGTAEAVPLRKTYPAFAEGVPLSKADSASAYTLHI
jgi:hypothetical protein